MGVHEFTAVLAIITITLGCSGVIAVFVTAATVHRSRGRGWPHFIARIMRLTVVIAAFLLAVELAAVVWDLVV